MRSQSLVKPPRSPDLAPHGERLPELDPDDGPLLRTPAGVQHRPQDAVDVEPGGEARVRQGAILYDSSS